MKVVLTGSGGFLGRHILETLSGREQYEVIALTSQTDALQSQYAGDNKICVMQSKEYGQIDFSKIDLLISCAFPTKPDDGIGLAQGMQYVCQLLCTASEAGVEQIIDISTQSVYGTQRSSEADEQTIINLDTKYAAGKYYTELMLNEICHRSRVVHYRMTSLIGPGYDQRITNVLIRRLIEGAPLRIVDGKQVMGYMDVRDGAEAVVDSIPFLRQVPHKEIFNIAGEAHSLFEITDTIVKVGYEYGLTADSIIREETGKTRNTGLNASKFRSTFEWQPRYSLEEAIREIYKEMLSVEKKVK